MTHPNCVQHHAIRDDVARTLTGLGWTVQVERRVPRLNPGRLLPVDLRQPGRGYVACDVVGARPAGSGVVLFEIKTAVDAGVLSHAARQLRMGRYGLWALGETVEAMVVVSPTISLDLAVAARRVPDIYVITPAEIESLFTVVRGRSDADWREAA